MSHSKIFQRNRALGYVSNHIPLVTRYIICRKENLIVTCTGRSFHTYGCTHFTLLSVSPPHAEDITSLAADTYHVFTASGAKIFAWRRGNELKHTYEGHDHTVHLILPFGAHLVSIDEESNMIIWHIKKESIVAEMGFSNQIFRVTTLMHPSTYLNKILLGSHNGEMQLWNINSMKLIHTFSNNWNCSIVCLEQAPAKDVVAVGLVDGRIILHDLKTDETLFKLMQDWGPVTSISFRSELGGLPLMTTGTMEGHVIIWNLEDRRIESQITKAHNASVTGMEFLPQEPLLVTSSPDNTLKLWIFDTSDGRARLLRIREGHAEPPTFIRFYGDNGHNILSVGGDSTMRIFSTLTETFNKNLGRASYNRKSSKKKNRLVEDPMIMPPMTEFAVEITREKDWDNVVACHLGLGVVTSWSYNKLKMGEHKFLSDKVKYKTNVTATAVCITQCGNFVVVGYNNGLLEKFNLQSGIHRGSYGDESAHEGAVKGIGVDCLNEVMVSAGKDKMVKFWNFKAKLACVPIWEEEVEEPVEWLRTHRENSLVCLALQDFSLVILDMSVKRIIRRFEGHTGRLTDATFSPDCRWLITASMDHTIRVWDLPSNQLIDIFKVTEACVSLNFSPTGEFLATAHACNLGIYLWSNRTLYTHVSLKAFDKEKEIPMINLPGSCANAGNENGDNEVEEDAKIEEYFSPDQLNKKLITLSNLATSRWLNLLNLDVIKLRNKPKQAPKKAEDAPFFLPTVPSLQVEFDFSNLKNKDQDDSLSVHPDFHDFTSFGQLLRRTIETDDFEEAINKLKSMSPSAIDFEIQSLSMDLQNTTLMLLQFMKMIKSMMKSKADFQLAQAHLAVFLKIHGAKIADEESILESLISLKKFQLRNWKILREKIFYNLSVVKMLKNY